jgi:hypothetical protein
LIPSYPKLSTVRFMINTLRLSNYSMASDQSILAWSLSSASICRHPSFTSLSLSNSRPFQGDDCVPFSLYPT